MLNPYARLPDYHFWRRSVSGRAPAEIDLIVHPAFAIRPTDLVATAGSCFAQHIARTLRARDCNYFIAEDCPATPAATNENYGVFSARYGNIYTTRQLRQLFRRAYGLFDPLDVAWRRADGRFIDPFRPRIQQDGFASVEDLLVERQAHFAAVQRMFETCDIFIFTLGLTEGWESTADGAVFPLAPGTVGGEGDAAKYAFHNFTVAEMIADLDWFVVALRQVNPACRVLLTVSPVALVATHEDEHVVVANSYSKSALRVVAEAIRRSHLLVDYFPSYELVTGQHTRGAFYQDDLREVTEAGVAHVMSLFTKHYLDRSATRDPAAPLAASPSGAALNAETLARMRVMQDIVCDEEQIELGLR